MKEKIITFQLGDKVAAEGHQANIIIPRGSTGAMVHTDPFSGRLELTSAQKWLAGKSEVELA